MSERPGRTVREHTPPREEHGPSEEGPGPTGGGNIPTEGRRPTSEGNKTKERRDRPRGGGRTRSSKRRKSPTSKPSRETTEPSSQESNLTPASGSREADPRASSDQEDRPQTNDQLEAGPLTDSQAENLPSQAAGQRPVEQPVEQPAESDTQRELRMPGGWAEIEAGRENATRESSAAQAGWFSLWPSLQNTARDFWRVVTTKREGVPSEPVLTREGGRVQVLERPTAMILPPSTVRTPARSNRGASVETEDEHTFYSLNGSNMV
jgi:hypothetical protein